MSRTSHQLDEDEKKEDRQRKRHHHRKEEKNGDEDAVAMIQELFRRDEEAITGPGDPMEDMLGDLQATLDASAYELQAPPDLTDRIAQGLLDLSGSENPALSDAQVLDRLAQRELVREDALAAEAEEDENQYLPSAAFEQRRTYQLKRVAKHLVTHRRAILTKIVLGAIGLVGVYGLTAALSAAGASLGLFSLGSTAATAAASTLGVATTTAASSSAGAAAAAAGLPSWVNALYIVLRSMGWDRSMLRLTSLAIQQNQSVRAWGKVAVVPPRARALLRRYGIPSGYLDASVASLVERAMSEGLALTNAGNVASYMFSAGASYTVGSAIDATVGAATKTKAKPKVDAKPKPKVMVDAEPVIAEAIATIGALRTLTRADGMDRAPKHLIASGSVFETIEAMDQQVTLAIEQKKLEKTQLLLDPIAQVQQQQKKEEPIEETAQMSNALRVAGVMGATLALALCPGQVAGTALVMAQNMALSALIEKTGLAGFAGKYAGLLSAAAIGQLVDLSKPLGAATTRGKKGNEKERSAAQRAFFALLLGEQVFSEAEIARMSEADVRQALESAHVAPEWLAKQKRAGRAGAGSVVGWRRILREFQASRLAVTRGALVESLASQLARSATSLALADVTREWLTQQTYGDTLSDANELDSVAKKAGSTESERNSLRVASTDAEFQKRHMTAGFDQNPSAVVAGDGNLVNQEALSGLRKLNAYLAANPTVAAELSLPPAPAQQHSATFQQPQSRLDQEPQPLVLVMGDQQQQPQPLVSHAQLDAIRAERRTISVARDQARLEMQIGKAATQLHWSPETRAAIKTRADLQRAITDVQLVQAQPGLGLRAAEMGSLAPEQLIPEEMMKRFNTIEFAPLYTTVRNRAVDLAATGASQWIPGVGLLQTAIDGVNTNLDVADTARNAWNLSVAINELFTLDPRAKEVLGYLPTHDFGRLPRISQLAADALSPAEKLKAGNLLMKNIVLGIQNQWSKGELLRNIALDSLGRDAASADASRMAEPVAKFLNQDFWAHLLR